METVILRSDVARLVLRYLQDQRLSAVSRQFCKSSPYLKEEFDAYKHGLQAHCFFPTLEEIIGEYVKILQKVDQILPTLPENVQIGLRQLSLSEKINDILQIQKDAKHLELSEIINNQSSSTADENAENALQKGKGIKRKRRISNLYTESASDTEHIPKKRCLVQKYYFLNSKHKNKNYSDKAIESTADETSESDEQDQSNNTAIDLDILKLDMPNSESTPHNKLPKSKVVAKTLPEITQAILENDEFQKKLVNNINEALNSAEKPNEKTKQIDANKTSSENQISPSQLLDEMVKNILEATERDPTFDAIIQEVVGAPNTKTDSNDNTPVPLENNKSVQANSNSLATANILPCSNEPTILPRTPLLIRNAKVATTTVEGSGTNTIARTASQVNSNNLLNMFADTSFSISRLCNINSNENANKQQGGQADHSIVSIGNSTADHILSHLANANEATTLAANEEQIITDIGNGPLFPVYISNDGTVTPITTYLLNGNEMSLANNVLGNQILTAPIVLTSALDTACEKINNAPILLNSVSKTGISNAKEEKNNKGSNDAAAAVIPINIGVLTENHNVVENGTTPSTSGIVNKKISKSFSTPRRRTTPSHIRALTFSPASSVAPLVSSGATPLSTRRSIQTSKTDVDDDISTSNKQKTKTTEKPIIRNVEILPQLPISTTTTTKTVTPALCNESSNSCSVPPLFATEEHSNQTVIKTELTVLEKNTTSVKHVAAASIVKKKLAQKNSNEETENTPKRKQSRRTAVRRCKRQLSKSSNEEETEVEATTSSKHTATIQTKQNADTTTKELQTKEMPLASIEDLTKKEITLEDWKKLRSCTYSNLDARLREINASKIETNTQSAVKRQTKKKTRAKRLIGNKNTNTKADAAKVAVEEEQEKSESNATAKQQTTTETNAPHLNDAENNKLETASTKNIAPPTATNEKCVVVAAAAVAAAEVERRMANIGYLLETPFKDATNGEAGVGFVPPTPGVFLPTLDTPLTKTKDYDELRESASFLFGSLTKSELGTPQLSAITPGFRFTPLVAKDATTPHSVAPTEYSSGGSYYRPDESEDLDRNFDKLLRDSVQKKNPIETQQQHLAVTPVHHLEENENEIEIVEIPVETLKVAPIVLRRVKSFGQEGAESAENGAQENAVDPHYTLASGLPKIYLEKEEALVPNTTSTASSSSSAASSSSSSSNSSSSSSSSSSDSTASDSDVEEHAATSHKTDKTISPRFLSLENLSDISSADDDEDWHKMEKNIKTDEKLELIDNYGEVRFPVRSWLTPRKADGEASTNVIKMTLKSAEKLNRQAELASKRERMKEKLKQDIPPAPRVKTKVQRRQCTVNTIKKQTQKPVAKQELSASELHVEKEAAPVDVLTALQLSVKKTTLPTTNTSPTKSTPPTPGEVDDNAVSHVIAATSKDVNVTKVLPAISSKTTIKTLFPSMINQGTRKCLQIEALPAMKSSRAMSKSTKQIVRTPLGFKGTSAGVANNTVTNSTNPNKPNIIKISPKPKIKIAPTTIGCASGDKILAEKVRVSPRLQTSEKSQKLKEPNKALKTTKKNPPPAKKPQNKGNLKKKQQPNAASKVKQAQIVESTKQPTEVAAMKRDRKQITGANMEHRTQSSSSNAITTTTNDEKSVVTELNNKSISPTRSVEENKQNKATFESQVVDNGDDDDEDDSDDPLEDCIRVTLSENDRHCYFNYVHDIENIAQTIRPISPNKISNELKKFQLHVAFDGNAKHTWRISEEFCLFEQTPTVAIVKSPTPPPQSIRNIPKKRRVCIISNSPINNEVDSVNNSSGDTKQQKSSNQTQAELLTESTESKQKQNENNSKPLSTDSGTTKNIHLSNNPLVQPLTLPLTSATTTSTDKIQIGDIESILSQLHDSENT